MQQKNQVEKVKNLAWLQAVATFKPASHVFLFAFRNVSIGSNSQDPVANCKLSDRADFYHQIFKTGSLGKA